MYLEVACRHIGGLIYGLNIRYKKGTEIYEDVQEGRLKIYRNYEVGGYDVSYKEFDRWVKTTEQYRVHATETCGSCHLKFNMRTHMGVPDKEKNLDGMARKNKNAYRGNLCLDCSVQYGFMKRPQLKDLPKKEKIKVKMENWEKMWGAKGEDMIKKIEDSGHTVPEGIIKEIRG